MKYRKLRIAWSAGWGVLCLLLIVLWVRSYWFVETLVVRLGPNNHIMLTQFEGKVLAGWAWAASPSKLVSYFGGSAKQAYREYQAAGDINGQRVWQGYGFKLLSWTRMRGISVPHLFSTMALAAFAAVPWLRWRFSLRTLLIGMTLVAVALGAAIYAVR